MVRDNSDRISVPVNSCLYYWTRLVYLSFITSTINLSFVDYDLCLVLESVVLYKEGIQGR